ncbi:SCO6745 family protein [Streptomyces sp. enrichment culture]|uniref:SCO6745 family protein n=1 Tax=Streptomyces sp. enrichment culture TaxID=1795815 RepID=UPI003F561E50
MTTAALEPHAGRRCHNALNTLHSTLYFSPDLFRELGELGITDPRAVNFAARAAALGPVGAGTVTAAFYNYKHELVARHVPAVWRSAAPEQVLAARLRAVDATLRRLLGEEAVASEEMAQAARLALRAAEGCSRSARPLYSAHADLPVPEEPHLALWHAATLLREHRGDGHLAVLMGAELDGLEAMVTHTATGRGMAPKWVLTTRGWTREDWDAAVARLRERGLLDGSGELTERGVALREEIERETDRLDAAPYARLGAEGVARLTGIAAGFARTAAGAGAFPADLRGKG